MERRGRRGREGIFISRQFAGKLIISMLLKNVQMQGPRNPFVEAIHELPLQDVRRNDACAPKRFSAQATKDLPASRQG
ncbi:MAG: hypothetical protein WCO26_24445, partial [Deltaproteobacteria bacterium]